MIDLTAITMFADDPTFGGEILIGPLLCGHEDCRLPLRGEDGPDEVSCTSHGCGMGDMNLGFLQLSLECLEIVRQIGVHASRECPCEDVVRCWWTELLPLIRLVPVISEGYMELDKYEIKELKLASQGSPEYMAELAEERQSLSEAVEDLLEHHEEFARDLRWET